MKKKRTIIISVTLVLLVVVFAFSIYSTSANYDNDPNLEVYGWAYKLTHLSLPAPTTLTYDYSDLIGHITNEDNLDLYVYDDVSPNPPQWNRAHATLVKEANTLTLIVNSYPSTYVLGEILNTKKQKEKVILQVAMNYNEAIQLNGHLTNVHLFSEETTKTETNLSQRGKNSATKYFLIPKEMRKDLKFNRKVMCQRIDNGSKTFFIYVIDKNY